MDTLSACVAFAVALAAWDVGRRYLIVRQFNEAALERLRIAEQTTQQTKQQVDDLKQRFHLSAGANATRMSGSMLRSKA